MGCVKKICTHRIFEVDRDGKEGVPRQNSMRTVDCKSAGCGLRTTEQTKGCAAFVGRCPDSNKKNLTNKFDF